MPLLAVAAGGPPVGLKARDIVTAVNGFLWKTKISVQRLLLINQGQESELVICGFRGRWNLSVRATNLYAARSYSRTEME